MCMCIVYMNMYMCILYVCVCAYIHICVLIGMEHGAPDLCSDYVKTRGKCNLSDNLQR